MQTDKYGKHEVLHTSHIIAQMRHDFIVKHGFVENNSQLTQKADKIALEIGEFYQGVVKQEHKNHE